MIQIFIVYSDPLPHTAAHNSTKWRTGAQPRSTTATHCTTTACSGQAQSTQHTAHSATAAQHRSRRTTQHKEVELWSGWITLSISFWQQRRLQQRDSLSGPINTKRYIGRAHMAVLLPFETMEALLAGIMCLIVGLMKSRNHSLQRPRGEWEPFARLQRLLRRTCRQRCAT
jgi:hypothetical protein